jgi:hypothetical protein
MSAWQEHQRKILKEAFTAGWQAGLAVRLTSPEALAVVESCFEMWLEEEVDERHVFGLPFRRRYDLPRPQPETLLDGPFAFTPPGPTPRIPAPRSPSHRREPAKRVEDRPRVNDSP